MLVIQKYKALDGSVFNSEEDCKNYELLETKVNKILKRLNPLPKDESCRFSNGEGYIQQDKNIIEKARVDLTELGNRFFKQKDKWSFYAIGRLFDDSNNLCLYSAWGRLSNVDVYYREWGQKYYAINPNKGIQEPFKL